ncbi:MAG: guanylate kinase [Elusimicrobia bacterium]|nr:guanylate kinase [Elusimicrobiota bacterium]MDA8242956.1 guanylate kinase [Elusimicrobiota bacterium]
MKRTAGRCFPLVLSSPSGGGKTAVRSALLELDPKFAFSVTCTTRPRRPGEVDGRDYYFVTESRFLKLRKSGKLLEWARVHGNYYGTPVRSVRDVLAKGRIPVMTIDVKGARAVRRLFPGAVTVFLLPPDLKTLLKRLRARGESGEGLKVRMRTASAELREVGRFGYLVVNDALADAVAAVAGIAAAEAARTERSAGIARRFAEQLAKFKDL